MSQVATNQKPRQREQPFDDEAYRRHLHSLPCRRCGATTGCQAAHLGHARGTGYKESVDECTHLCPRCHHEFDTAKEGKGKWWLTQIAIPEARTEYRRWKRLFNITSLSDRGENG